MKNYIVKRYNKLDFNHWNTFITQSKNGTFLFHRDFMDYHSDRFDDYSLIILDGEKWIAVLPANIINNEVHTHQGLTYGGLLYYDKIKLATIIEVFKTLLQYLYENNIEKLFVKTIPTIYHQKPTQEMHYVLFLVNARLTRRDSLSVLDLREVNVITKGRKEGVEKGKKSKLIVQEVIDLEPFWNKILIPNMTKKYDANPVHSLEEITKLKTAFPDNIRQFNVYHNGNIVAGTTIFVSNCVAHSQYISANENANTNGSLDFLYYELITNIFADKKYLDFGISNEYQGRKLNFGLSFWKESFGASTVVQDFYEVETKNYPMFETVLK